MEPEYGIINTTLCCGVRQLYGISEMTAENIAYTVGSGIINGGRTNGAFYTFSDNTFGEGGTHYGDVLRDFIRDNNFGDVIETEPKHNPNSGNELKFYVWTLNRESLLEWTRTKQSEQYEGLLRGHNLAIGDFVRCSESSPNSFTGRAVIDRIDDTHIRVVRKDGEGWFMLHEEIGVLVKTRKFTVDNNN